MLTRHYDHWPKLSTSLTIPATPLYDNLTVSANRYPDHQAIYYYGNAISYRQLLREVDSLAGYLQQELGVSKGEKILLYMQNSPQFVIGYYAISKAGGAVVPINPMLTAEELEFYVKDCGIVNALVGQELYGNVASLRKSTTLKNLIIAAYSDYTRDSFPLDLPEEVKKPQIEFGFPNHYHWKDCVRTGYAPKEQEIKSGDLAVLPYTSGTTGLPKGCMHTNSSVQANTVGAANWAGATANNVHLPHYHFSM